MLWGLDGAGGLTLFYLDPAPDLIASFTVLHLNILHSISSFFLFLSVFVFCCCGVYC